jgi:hypothetical protein
MIIIPILILQIFLFPLTVSWIMNTWVDSRQTIALQEAVSYISSSIQQSYSALNHESVTECIVTIRMTIPALIEGHVYTGNATLRNTLDAEFNFIKVLDITCSLLGSSVSSISSVTLGQNVEWQSSTFISNSTDPSIKAEKYWDGTDFVIRLSFGET